MANGLVIAAPRSGSGKTLVTLGLLAALRRRGLTVAPAKTGPDYIDRAHLSRAAGTEAINLDPWAMKPDRLAAIATELMLARQTSLSVMPGTLRSTPARAAACRAGFCPFAPWRTLPIAM